jgi:hypothetical protein
MMLSRTLRIVLPIAVVATALLAPTSAHATLVGMESNRELVNTTQSAQDQDDALQKMQDQGVQVVRANWRWYEVAGACGGQSPNQLSKHTNSCYDWSRLDTLVKGAGKHRMKVLLSLTQNPAWLQPNVPANIRNFSDPVYYMGSSSRDFNRTVTHYAAFYKAAASRYRPGTGKGVVHFWTIHNEPNSDFYWGAKPNPARYAMLYARAAVAVKQGWGGAKVAPGPTGPSGGNGGMKPIPFIKVFQRSVVKYLPGSMAKKRRYINAWALNPYPGTTTQPSVYNPRVLHKDSITMGAIDRAFKALDAAPITKNTKLWATEFGWQTAPERDLATSFDKQAQFIAESFDWLSSKRNRVELGINYGLSDPEDVENDWQSGTFTNDGRPKKSFAMFQRMISVPQGGLSGRVRANTKLRVWGRANVNPRGTVISYRILGGKCDKRAAVSGYCKVKGQRAVPGTSGAKYGYVTVRRGQRLEFATYDKVAKVYGPVRRITVR